MSRKWLAALGIFNLVAVLNAVSCFFVSFAILTPERLQFEAGDVESVKRAIGQAELHGIRSMGNLMMPAVAGLVLAVVLNFIFLWRGRKRASAIGHELAS